jgi:hypothetical protein
MRHLMTYEVQVAWQCSSEGPPDHSDIVEDDCRHTAANPGKENETTDAVYEPRQHQVTVEADVRFNMKYSYVDVCDSRAAMIFTF